MVREFIAVVSLVMCIIVVSIFIGGEIFFVIIHQELVRAELVQHAIYNLWWILPLMIFENIFIYSTFRKYKDEQ